MTSFAFILGVVPLVTATGAGANARISLGISGVQRHDRLDLPGRAVRALFFVLLQRFEEWRKRRKQPAAAAARRRPVPRGSARTSRPDGSSGFRGALTAAAARSAPPPP